MIINKIINKYDEFLNNIRLHSSIHTLDNKNMIIEYCKGVDVLNENEIRLVLAKCIVTIVGLNLKMRNFNRNGVEINGKIHSISFDECIRKDRK